MPSTSLAVERRRFTVRRTGGGRAGSGCGRARCGRRRRCPGVRGARRHRGGIGSCRRIIHRFDGDRRLVARIGRRVPDRGHGGPGVDRVLAGRLCPPRRIAAGHASTGYLQLTDATGSRKGGAVYTKASPSALGLDVTFDQWQYSPASNGGDGLSFFLADGAATVTSTGGQGSSLGYAQNTNMPPAPNGIAGAYLGVGFDAHGAFATSNDGHGTGCATGQSTSFPDQLGRAARAGFGQVRLLLSRIDQPADRFAEASRRAQRPSRHHARDGPQVPGDGVA